jgi:uncharacterized membrane protein YjdF
VNSFKTIAWITTVGFLLITFVAQGPATYRFAILFLAPILWGVYFLRERLQVHPLHFAILASALVLHNLGAFGAYRQKYLGFDFDMYVHFYFGVAGGFVVARGLRVILGFRGWQLWLGTVLVILGIGGLHELIEYGSTLVLGPEKGMLKLNAPDAKTDTQNDLLNNLMGTLLALALYSVFGRSRTSASEPDSEYASKVAATH